MSVRGPPHQSRRENSPRRGPDSEALTTAAPHHPGRGTSRVARSSGGKGWGVIVVEVGWVEFF